MPKKPFSFRGASPHDQGLCPWTSLGAPPPEPLIGSCSVLAMCHPHFQIASAASGHKPGGRLPLLSARPAVTLATLKKAATNFPAW